MADSFEGPFIVATGEDLPRALLDRWRKKTMAAVNIKQKSVDLSIPTFALLRLIEMADRAAAATITADDQEHAYGDPARGETLVEAYDLTRCWAVFTGSEGDSPDLAAVFPAGNVHDEERITDLAKTTNKDGDPLFFDPCVIAGIVLRGRLFVANDYRCETHEQLFDALKSHGLVPEGATLG